MRFILLSVYLVTSFSVFASEVVREQNFTSFDQAKDSKTYLKFTVESTKVGLFSSDVDGYVKKFQYTTKVDRKNYILRDMKIIIDAKSLDTENNDRDEKLRNLCLSSEKYPKIEVIIKGPLFLKSVRPTVYQGIVKIRGQEKQIKVEITASLTDNELKLKGSSVWSLKKMEIPDPSILVAKLSDEIRINFQIVENITKEK